MDDHSPAIAAVALKLASVRLEHVDAGFTSGGKIGTGGKLEISTISKLGKSQSFENRYSCDTTLECKGIPAEGTEPVFRISVTIRGTFESRAALSTQILQHPSFQREIDKRLYSIAVTYVHQIARGMNLHGIRIPPEPEGTPDDVNGSVEQTTTTTAANEKATKPSRAKARVPRKALSRQD